MQGKSGQSKCYLSGSIYFKLNTFIGKTFPPLRRKIKTSNYIYQTNKSNCLKVFNSIYLALL